MSQTFSNALSLTLVGRQAGVTIVPPGSRLTRLHYYDGKFLRAAHLDLEQRYVQALVQVSNQAGGPGIVHGFSTVLGAGETLDIGEGLAIDPQGRVLLLPSPASVSIAELLSASGRPAGPIPYGDDNIVQPLPEPRPPRVIAERPPAREILTREILEIDRGSGAAGFAPRLLESQPMVRSYASHALDRSSAGFRLSDPDARRAREGAFGDCVAKPPEGPDRVVQPSDLYLVVIAHAEALCGQEDVYGRLCEAACTTRSERPYFVEGIVVRAVPLDLDVTLGQIGPVVLGVRHLRSRVASAYYAREATLIGSLISKAGLSLDTWCLGAEALGGFGVPIGVLARSGETTSFFDAWIARRERIEAPPKKYWAWRMAMRPWDVFLAQVLQFQCHLHELFLEAPVPGTTDPCREGRGLMDEASGALSTLKEYYEKVSGELARLRLPAEEVARLDIFKDRIGNVGRLIDRLDVARQGVGAGERVLIRGGILELPSAGYLPVAKSAELPVNTQVRNLLGEGVDLRFCVVRPDFVPHALEEAQHMERISLVQGLANPQDRPRVDILVPNGELIEQTAKPDGMAFQGKAQFLLTFVLGGGASASVAVTGAGRGEHLPTQGAAFHFAGVGRAPDNAELGTFIHRAVDFREVRERGEFGGIERAEPVVPEGVFRVREAARRVAPDRAYVWEAGGPVRGTPEGIPGGVLDQPTTRRLTAIWATLRSDEDPFGLQVGQEASLTGRMILVVPTARASVADVTMRGAIRVSDVTPSFTATDRCRGFLTLDVVWNGVFGNNAPIQQHDRIEGTIELERTDRSEGSNVRVTLTLGREAARKQATLVFETAWAGSPVSAQCEGRLGFGDRFERVLESRFEENADVLRPGNTQHDLAVTALEVIDAVIAEPAFKANAEQLLFPPAKAPSSEQVLRAKLDWVLFHRRREKECGGREAVVEVKTRRYKVYSGVIKRPDHAKLTLVALTKNQTAQLQRAQFVPVGIVEYAGGSPNLLTAATALADQWQHVGHGNRIIVAAMANQGEAVADGEPLSLARLKQLELALDPIGMKIDPDAVAAMLPAVPDPTLPADDTDGIIAIVTHLFVDIRRARVVLYRPAGRDNVRRLENRPDAAGGLAPLPDLTLLFRDNEVVEDNDARRLFDVLHELTRRAGEGLPKLELAPPQALDANAHKRALSAGDLLRRTLVDSAAGQRYPLLDPRAVVGTRALREANPDERNFLNEAGNPVDEIIALTFRD
jgi:hypothetical protein